MTKTKDVFLPDRNDVIINTSSYGQPVTLCVNLAAHTVDQFIDGEYTGVLGSVSLDCVCKAIARAKRCFAEQQR